MNFSTKIKNIKKIENFSLDNKKPKKQNLFFNLKLRNKNIKDNSNYNKLNKTMTECRKINLLKTNNINDDAIQILENELCLINSEKNINDVVKMFEIFQEELIYQLEDKYNELKINKIMKNNFEIIVKYIYSKSFLKL